MKRIFPLLTLTMAVCAACFMMGCASEMSGSRLDADYGTSHKLAKMNQTLNANAEKNLNPVEGMHGDAAEKVLEGYYKGFEKEKEGPTYTFKVGGASGK